MSAARPVVVQLAWPREVTTVCMHGTSRAMLLDGAGISLVDFATSTLYPATPVPAASATASPDGGYVVATSRDEAIAGAPILLRCVA